MPVHPLLTGLNEIADTILGHAAGIAKMRIESEKEKGTAEIGLLNARFLARLNTGEIKFDEYEAAFEEHKEKLESLADTMEFSPAKDAVKSSAMATLPEVYLHGATVLNQRNFSMISSNALSERNTIKNTPGTAQTRKVALEGFYSKYKGHPAINQETLEAWRQADEIEIKVDMGWETARAMGLNEGIKAMSSPDGRRSLGINEYDDDTANAILSRLTQERSANAARVLEGVALDISKNPTTYITDIGIKITGALKDTPVDEGTMAKVRAIYMDNNQNILKSTYRDMYNDARVKGRSALDELYKMLSREAHPTDSKSTADWTGQYEDERTELMNEIEGDIAAIDKATAAGLAKDGKIEESKALIAAKAAVVNYENGRLEGGYGHLISTIDKLMEDARQAADETTQNGLYALRGQIVAPDYVPAPKADDIKNFSARIAKLDYFAKAPSQLSSARAQEREYMVNWAIDFARDNPTGDLTSELAKFEGKMLAKDMDELKATRYSDSGNLDSKYANIGLMVQGGEADPLQYKDHKGSLIQAPGTERLDQFYADEATDLSNVYNITGTAAPSIDEQGRQSLRVGNTTYRYSYDQNKNRTLQKSTDGKSWIDVPAPAVASDEERPPEIRNTAAVSSLEKLWKILGNSEAGVEEKKTAILQHINAGTINARDLEARGYDLNGHKISAPVAPTGSAGTAGASPTQKPAPDREKSYAEKQQEQAAKPTEIAQAPATTIAKQPYTKTATIKKRHTDVTQALADKKNLSLELVKSYFTDKEIEDKAPEYLDAVDYLNERLEAIKQASSNKTRG